jgi:hypothetical protein
MYMQFDILLKIFIVIYSLKIRGFIVTNLIRLILYISYIAPIVSPSTPSCPPHLKQLQKVSLFYFI